MKKEDSNGFVCLTMEDSNSSNKVTLNYDCKVKSQEDKDSVDELGRTFGEGVEFRASFDSEKTLNEITNILFAVFGYAPTFLRNVVTNTQNTPNTGGDPS
jgi:hypothetical protein